MCSLVERARKTVRGSADDIGWLQRDPTLPTTEDGNARFLEILESVRSAKVTNWTSMLIISTNAFNERCDLMWVISFLFRKNEHKLPDSVVYLLVPG